MPHTWVIVPFRDTPLQNRAAQAETFTKAFRETFPKETTVLIVDDGDLAPRLFDRGTALNVGYDAIRRFQRDLLEAASQSAEPSPFSETAILLHDVDLISSGKALLDHYTSPCPPKTAVHLAACWDRYPYDHYIGGVLKVGLGPDSAFEAANGFPSFFTGWGGEDDALAARFRARGIKVTKFRPGEGEEGAYRDLEEEDEAPRASETEALKNPLKWEARELDKKTRGCHGLKQLGRALKTWVIKEASPSFLHLAIQKERFAAILIPEVKVKRKYRSRRRNRSRHTK